MSQKKGLNCPTYATEILSVIIIAYDFFNQENNIACSAHLLRKVEKILTVFKFPCGNTRKTCLIYEQKQLEKHILDGLK